MLALKRLNRQTVPVIYATHLTPEQKLGYMIADNRLTENAKWDKKILGEIFKDLSEVDLSFDMGEIDILIEGLDIIEADTADSYCTSSWSARGIPIE